MNKVKQLGQGMTEYIIIVALIAIAGIAAYSFFGQTMQGAVADVSSELAGKASANKAAVGAASANKAADSAEDMSSFAEDANTGNTAK